MTIFAPHQSHNSGDELAAYKNSIDHIEEDAYPNTKNPKLINCNL